MAKLILSIKLKYKLFLIFAINNVLIIGSMWQVCLWSFDQGFTNYVSQQDKNSLQEMVSRVESLYDYYGDWDFLLVENQLENAWYQNQLSDITSADIPFPLTPNLNSICPSQGYRKRFLLYNSHKESLIGDVDFDSIKAEPILIRGDLVGYIGLRSIDSILQNHSLKFAKQQGEAFLLISAFLLTIAALTTWWLAKFLSRPICEMSETTRIMTSGNYSTRIRSNYSDELGQLAFDLNHLASTLEDSAQARKRWVADTAHELRTPLAILRSEIEAMQDGIIKVTPESLESLLNETVHLGRLIEDLNQLSKHDTGNMDYKMTDINLIEIVNNSVASMQRTFEEAGIEMTLDTERKKSIAITADSNRLSQVFSNLMNNTLKYTNSPGKLAIKVHNAAKSVIITFEDSAPGVDEQDIEKVFDRFFRVECSRNREKGGRGLGLSICRSIVEGHRGNINVYNSPLGGIGIKIELPTI